MVFTRRSGIALLALALATGSAFASTAWTYQGRLRSASNPVTGNYDFIFDLYDAASGGTLLGTQNVNALAVSGGLFTATLDFGNLFPSSGRWLAIRVRPAGGGSYTTLTPRQAITPTPYAIGLELPFSAETSNAGTAFYVQNDNATGIAGSSPNNAGVAGTNTNSSSVSSAGVVGSSTAANGNGVSGFADNGSSAYGVYGEAVAGLGVYGFSSTGTGVLGTSDSGVGVNAASNSAAGAMGSSNAGPGVQGVNNGSSSVTSAGVYGSSTASEGNGVTGIADNGANAYGVYGEAAQGYGFVGFGGTAGASISSGTGPGVSGLNTNSSSTLSPGVLGQSTASSGNGVSGICDVGGAAYGVYGESTTGLAGFFSGNVSVSGNLSKGGGSFKIDHPLDPANKYLYHSFVESPDMMNVYNGNVVTDASGYATITMPEWFQTLNRDFRYQLTVMGQFAQAIVSQEMQNNQFTIQTDKPGVKVSWQVTGIRQDAWANAHRIPVEEVKPDFERGFYLHPELYGATAAQSVVAAKAQLAEQNQQQDAAAPTLPAGKAPVARPVPPMPSK